MPETERERQRRLLQAICSDVARARSDVQRDPSLLTARDGAGETAFHYAVIENQADVAEQLLRWGSEINTQDHAGVTPLMHAVQLGYLEMVKWLVSEGARTELKDRDGATALSNATRNDRSEIFEFLLSLPRAADINAYYDDLPAQDVFDGPALVMRETLVRLGLKRRFER